MTPIPKYKSGDRVVAAIYGSGTIVSVTKSGAVVRFDRGRELRRSVSELRYETSKDIAKHEHEASMEAWRAQKPATEHTRMTLPMTLAWGNADPDGAAVTAADRMQGELGVHSQ